MRLREPLPLKQMLLLHGHWRWVGLIAIGSLAAGALCAMVIPSRHDTISVQYVSTLAEAMLALAALIAVLALVVGLLLQCGAKQGRAQADAASRAAETRFRHNLHHELSNPLTAINTGLSHLAHAELEPEYARMWTIVHDQVSHVSRVVASLRKLMDLEHEALIREPIDVQLLLRNLYETCSLDPQTSGRSLRLVVSEAWPLPTVLGDEDLLFLALYNLVNNGLKFIPEGGKVDVLALRHDGGLAIQVYDNGIGIPPESMAYIWEPLYRAANARGLPGSGLGLPLARTIIGRHRGRIEVSSSAERGTLFTVWLPTA